MGQRTPFGRPTGGPPTRGGGPRAGVVLGYALGWTAFRSGRSNGDILPALRVKPTKALWNRPKHNPKTDPWNVTEVVFAHHIDQG